MSSCVNIYKSYLDSTPPPSTRIMDISTDDDSTYIHISKLNIYIYYINIIICLHYFKKQMRYRRTFVLSSTVLQLFLSATRSDF